MSQSSGAGVVRTRGKRVDAEPCLACGGPMTSYESRKKGYHKGCEPSPGAGRSE